MTLGFIYILTNKDMPNLIKIGKTAADPDSRAAELFTTGIPSRFKIEYKGLFDDYGDLERRIHRALTPERHSGNREFFRIDVPSAILKIREVATTPAKYEEIRYLSPSVIQEAKRKAEMEEKRAKDRAAWERAQNEKRTEEVKRKNKNIMAMQQSYIDEQLNEPFLVRYLLIPFGFIIVILIGFMIAIAIGPLGWIGVPLALWWFYANDKKNTSERLKKEAAARFPLLK